ncbi:NAD-dependent epimerase/dehydratase family protein [Halocalculus aciditolerans]|uniref:CDP-paratose 2-epimerase n=1 Tax=Halocalculus aciditolerans TaxID=1383812 RepID=A0A830F6K7_9EURY|nr:NAD-dependent epimerase/dehydratase family protein [Halocalculus aciditolerans]GGL59554.1 CDP-paratose 2-epimerase [Halocalculus aciditolerans]
MTHTYSVGVTGAAGYIGSRVTRNLLADGHDVVPVDDFSVGTVETVEGTTIETLDVRNTDALAEAFAGVDAVMHLAAVSGVQDCDDDPDEAFDVNVRGTEDVARLCRETGTPLVFPTSMAILGDIVETPITVDHPRDPLNTYGLTKRMSEDDVHALAAHEFPAHVYMKSNIYGHHEIDGETVGKNTVINIFADRAKEGKHLEVHEPGTQARDFIHVKDVARAYSLSLERLVGGDVEPGAETIPLASGEEYSVLALAELVQRVTREELGVEIDIEMVENPRSAETDAADFTVDTSHARDAIGFETEHSVEETVRELVSA